MRVSTISNASMTAFIVTSFIIFGFIVGSFLNVVVFRMRSGMGISGRSECLSCRKQLGWWELVPIVSYCMLRGKCASCRTPFSIQYVLVESITGILFGIIGFQFLGLAFQNLSLFIVTTLFWVIVTSIMVVIATYDIRHKVIDGSFLIAFTILVLIGVLFGDFSHGFFAITGWQGIGIGPFVSALLVSAPFFILWLLSRGAWIGFGDIEIMALFGLAFGLMRGFSAVIFGFWLGALFVTVVFAYLYVRSMISKSYKVAINPKHAIPFGPFLFAGFFLVGVLGVNLFSILGV